MILNALNICHDALKRSVKPASFCIDATAGNGGDTLFLCELVGKEGKVAAFDIQPEAIAATEKRATEAGFGDICTTILDSHANMASYFPQNSADVIVFNFGWLPGGNHDIFTKKDSSLAAIEQGLGILKPGGLMSLCVYYGRNNGYEERDAILSYLATLDYRKYTVISLSFLNRVNDPPFPIFIYKEA